MTVNPITPQQQTQSEQAPVSPEAAPVQAAPEEKPLSPQFAALAKQQKLLRKAQMELEAREAAFKAKESEYATSYIPKSKLKENPYGVLTEEGIPYESIMNQALNQDPTSLELQKIKREMEAMKADSQKAADQAKSAQQQAYEEAVNHIRNEATELVAKSPEFEMIKANNAEEAVVELIRETFDSTKKLLTVAEAAQKVEDYLLEHALKIAGLNKVKQKLSPQQIEQQQTEDVPAVQAKPRTNTVSVQPAAQRSPQNQMKTITNAATMVASKPLTEKQRRERAIAAFRGQQIA